MSEKQQEAALRLDELKRRFIVPADAVVDLVKPRRRAGILDYFYCPYAPCCSRCVGVFTFREALDHLRRVHKHDAGRIKKLVASGLPQVPMRRH
jgi:hypothetical protein